MNPGQPREPRRNQENPRAQESPAAIVFEYTGLERQIQGYIAWVPKEFRITGFYSLGTRSIVKYTVLYSFGCKIVVKCAGLYIMGIKSVVKVIGSRRPGGLAE